ncbi:restriction endonuclease subunit S [Candidatus Parcubacteria bacterium]|nr:MAG: restriction endonuclease subunit S [Candidatus Parcubacteria bacterium]
MMKLEKDKWERVQLWNVCKKAKKVDIRRQTGSFNYIDIGSIDSNLKRISELQRISWNEASSRARQIVMKNDTLFSTVRVNLERIALVTNDIPDAIASTGFTVIRSNGKVDTIFLFYVCSSPNFIAKVIELQKGTAYPAVTDKIVFNQEIPIPPLHEQQQIAELFQNLEEVMGKAEKQNENLKSLRKTLIKGLLNKEPVFGNLLSVKNCRPVRFDNIADCIEEHDKQPLDNGITRFIGLENIEADNFQLQGFGNIADGTTFTKRFSKGDVLFGKRRAYLKKVAVADFDGVCSGDILVFRAREDIMLPELLPYYASSEAFINHAVNTSAGSLSPRTKWRDLSSFKIAIPEIKAQEKIVDVFNKLETTIIQLKKQKQTLKTLKQKLLNEILG